VTAVFKLITGPIASYKQLDRILAAEARRSCRQLAAWLLIYFIGYTLLVWVVHVVGIHSARSPWPCPQCVGTHEAAGCCERISPDRQRGQRLIIVTRRIAYLPTCTQRSTGALRKRCRCGTRGPVPRLGAGAAGPYYYCPGLGRLAR